MSLDSVGIYRVYQSYGAALDQSPYYRKRFSDLAKNLQDKIHNYDLTIEELSGYGDEDIRDMFIRMNRYVVKLSRQELRNAKNSGKFYEFIEKVGDWDLWREEKS